MSKTTSPYTHRRYTGTCPVCETTVQAAPKRHADAHEPEAWVRCSCGQITRCTPGETATSESTDQ